MMMAATCDGATRVSKQYCSAAQRLGRRHAAILVRERRVVDLGGKRPEVLLVAGARRGEREARKRAAVEGAVEGDDARAVGVRAGDLHGVLGGLDAGREQQRLVRARRPRAR